MKKLKLFLASALALPLSAAEPVLTGRQSFIRDEKNACLEVHVKGAEKLPLNAVWNGKKIALPAKGNSFKLPVETRLFTGTYSGTLEFDGKKYTFSYRIGPQLPDDMPVLIWGFKGSHKALQALGINRGLHYPSLDNNPANFKRFEDAIADGFRYYGSVTTNQDRTLRKEIKNIMRNGNIAPHGVDASNPETTRRMMELIKKRTGLRWHPAAAGAILNSEIRAATRPSFAPHQVEAYKKFSGKDVPAEVNEKTGVPYQQLKNFPASRVVPDNHYILEYYRWFWRNGDGWNKLNSTMADALRKNASPGFICWHDPVLRTPPLPGSGGNVDILNHWTYANPEPCRITSHIDCMIEMARHSGQDIWAMTQIIAYRSRTTSLKVKPKVVPEWAKKYPKAQYISVAPDSLQEAIWTMIARPVKGLLFHGQASLMAVSKKKKQKQRYTLTNTDTQKTMKKMMQEVVNPLAPMLKRLPEVPSQVGVLQSFTSTILAERGTWGWRGWEDDLNLMLHYAGLNPRVIYEDNVLKHNALDGIKILAMPNCDVLTESIVKAVKAFQKRGGIVIGDPDLCPEIVPQVLVKKLKRSDAPDKIQTKIYRDSWKLKRELRRYLTINSDTDAHGLLRYERKWKNTSYYFVINDKRTYGDYLGPWKMVMEKGVPNRGNLQLYKKPKAVYELSRGGKVDFTDTKYYSRIALDFKTNDGRIYMALPAEIAKVSLKTPATVTAGEKFTVTAEILDTTGKPVQALLPVSFSITDAKGRTLDGGPYGCAIDGVWKFETVCPLNAEEKLQVVLKDRASGLKAEGTIKVRKAK